MRRFGLLFLLLSPSALLGQELTKSRLPELAEARKTGLLLANMVVEKLSSEDATKFPGMKNWSQDFQRFSEGLLAKSPDEWGNLDVDSLLTKNPHFWEMTYEIFPGDPGLMLLHAGVLMTAGELTRAAQIAYLGLQRNSIPKPFHVGLNSVITQYQKVNEKANIPVYAGIKRYDDGDYGQALRKYDEAINLWPQNPFAWYEAGLTMLQQERIAAGKKPIPSDPFAILDERLSKEVAHAFHRARMSDALQLRAYQGDEKELLATLAILNKKVIPSWDKLTQNHNKSASEELLTELANSFQEAQLHDYALIVRQVLIARRNRFLPEDHPFIASNLKKVIPPAEAESILKRLTSARIEFRQLVKPETEK